MSQEYQPFAIQVGELGEAGFPVEAEFHGASWSAIIPASLPLLTEQELQKASQWLERGFIDRDYAKDFGSRLFQTLFQGAIRDGFRTAYERVAPKDGLRIILSLPEQLTGLPWELMYDGEGEHGFLARSTTAPLVRHFEGLPLGHPPAKEGPLRVLIATASPHGYPTISSGEEAEEIYKHLIGRRMSIPDTLRLLGQHLFRGGSPLELIRRLRHRSLFEVDVLSYATRKKLQQRMVDARNAGRGFHVVHFIGHGRADESGGQLLFQAEDGSADAVQADEFAEMVGDEQTVNLAVLNACQTASSTHLFSGVAQATLQRGVPAVIGMQVPVLDRVAIEFAREFYGAWSAGEPIEGALAYARRLIREETPGAAADWGIPVLFTGPVKGITLNLVPPPLALPGWVKFLRWSVTALLSLLAAIALLLQVPDIARTVRTQVPIIRCVYPYPMSSEHSFNAAVAEFAVFDEGGSPVTSKDGRALADYLFEQLTFTFEELKLRFPYELRSPAQTCQIPGRTREQRETAAEALAERIKANVIIYGVITRTDDKSRFHPEFYVNYKGFEQGEEITGQHQLGKELYVASPFESDSLPDVDNPALSARVNALSLITVGLAYYAIDDFEAALDYFSKAEATKGWLRNAGKEVVYLLLGNAYIRQDSKEGSGEHLKEAWAQYSEALSINSNYARAKIGRAGVLYLMAWQEAPDDDALDRIDLGKLDEAAAAYQAALDLGAPPESANIETKVHYGLGEIYYARFLQALVTKGDWSIPMTQAITEFEQVVHEYDSGNPYVRNLAGHAHARLGLIARQHRDFDTAVQHYKDAIELVTPFYQHFYSSRLGEAFVDAGRIEPAIQSYQEAIIIAESYGDEESATKYTARLNELEEAKP